MTREEEQLETQETIRELTARLAEAQDVIDAIRQGAVDAVVVHGAPGPRVYTLETADRVYRLILERMAEGAMTLTPEGAILFGNRRMAEILRLTPGRLLGANLYDFVPGGRDPLEALLRLGLTGSARSEITLTADDGTEVPLLVSVSGLTDGQATFLCAVFTDLTEQKRAEIQLVAYQDSLRSLGSELVLVEERERRRLADLVHDELGQALAVLKLQSRTLMASVEDPAVISALTEMIGVMDQLISVARTLTSELSPTILYRLGLAEALHYTVEAVAGSGMKVLLETDAEPDWPLTEDAQITIYRAVRELLNNAHKYAQCTEIQITAHQDGNFLRLTVSDNGVGFDPATLHNTQGGFGLFSIRERLFHLGGSFVIDSAPGQGSRFTLTVPLATPK